MACMELVFSISNAAEIKWVPDLLSQLLKLQENAFMNLHLYT